MTQSDGKPEGIESRLMREEKPRRLARPARHSRKVALSWGADRSGARWLWIHGNGG